MPKRLRQQRRGKGKEVFRVPGFHFKAETKLRVYDEKEKNSRIDGKVVDIINDAARTAPTLIIEYEDGNVAAIPAPLGIKVGDNVSAGATAPIQVGNVLPLKNIPTGTKIYNIELVPGDGGKLVRAGGTAADIITKEGKIVTVKLPSKAFKRLNENCRAVIGTIAGFGRKEKPIVKAGKNFYITHSRGRYWPHVAGVAMNAVNHPHGGKRRSTQKSKKKPVSKDTSPGRKVGSIAPRRSGRKGKEKKIL